ncbi:MAG: filamentous hemagglutinin N-terminal domain-containing protein [Candidatus Omnitrophica bacterium]|nr:filamentous hemagglutinin N-terminal domain-containing protein [Candidatus Omnitrophota bacterium]MCM8791526.1 filamentous hemagglutinin N-terminal domain-containing protein [Candidatus Omnitrophota bacterium]
MKKNKQFKKWTQREKKNATVFFCLVAVFFMNLLYANSIAALPKDYEVAAGSAEFHVQENTLTVTASDKAIINYKSFDIAQNEKVIFNLPTTTSAVLNRVHSPDPTNIQGLLQCNGIFILVNQSGIYVAPGANVNAASMILSTRDINNSDFLAGRYSFHKVSQNGFDMLLLNEGNLAVSKGGFLALVAGAIENKGVITARSGTIALAAGNAVKFEIAGNNMISVAVTEPVAEQILDFEGKPVKDQIKNTGSLNAEGGTIILKAESVADIFINAVNLEGVVNAERVECKDGGVSIIAGGKVEIPAEQIITTRLEVFAKELVMLPPRIPERVIDGDVDVNTAEALHIMPSEPAQVIKAEESITIFAEKAIEVASTIETPTVTLVSGDMVDTRGAAIVQGTNFNLRANRFGKYETPVKIQAENSYVNGFNKNIDIREALGIGTSFLIRGPPDEGFGAIEYNRNLSRLTLEAEDVILSVTNPVYVDGHLILSNFLGLIPFIYLLSKGNNIVFPIVNGVSLLPFFVAHLIVIKTMSRAGRICAGLCAVGIRQELKLVERG